MLQLVARLAPPFCESLGCRLALDAVEKANIRHPLPNSFAPDQVHIKLVELARHSGHPLLVIKTPRELASSTAPRAIHQLQAPYDLGGFSQLVAQLNTPTASYARCYFFCNKESCLSLTCEAAIKAKADPFARRTLGKFFNVRALKADLPPDPLLDVVPPPGGGELLSLDHPPDAIPAPGPVDLLSSDFC